MSLALRAIKKAGLSKVFYCASKPFTGKALPGKHDVSDVLKSLREFSEKPTGTSIGQNQLSDSPEYDLMIVVPAYNVEKYIQECLDSVLEQKTTFRILLRVVNDGSSDRTEEILEQYKSVQNVQIIKQNNGGLSAARNAAIRQIPSRYLMFLDADDYLMPGSIQTLLEAAYSDDADIVEGNYERCDLNGVRFSVNTRHDDRLYDKAVGNLWGFACIKLIRSEMFRTILFPENYWFEDTIISMLVFPQAQKARTISSVVYIYRINTSGITGKARNNKKSLDSYWILQLLLEELNAHGIDVSQELYLQFLRQIVITQQRLEKQPTEIQQNAFLAGCALRERFFSDFHCEQRSWLQETESAMCKQQFSRFSLICRLAP